jgi:Sigma-70 factor, region 1.1
LSATLPLDELSSEEIEDTMTMLSELGITVTESDESEEPVAPEGEPAKARDNLDHDDIGRSFAIVTTQPNELCAELHNRMPVILAARGLAGMARRGAGRRAAPQIAAGPLPRRRHDLLAGERARRQCQE